MQISNSDRYIFIDLDGPVLDVSDKYYRLYLDILQQYGGMPLSKFEYWNCKRNKVKEEKILSLSDVNIVKDLNSIRKSMIESEIYLIYDSVMPCISQVLTVLKHYYTIILVTLRHNRSTLLWELQRLGLSDKFDLILSTAATGAESEHYLNKIDLIREYVGGNALTGFFVGDTETDIRTGNTLQLHTIAVSYGIRDKKYLEPLTPEYIVDTPEQLSDLFNSIVMNTVHIT